MALTDSVFAADATGAWVFAREGLFKVTKNKLVAVPLPSKDDWAQAALSVDGAQISVALSFDSASVEVFQSRDGGATWDNLGGVGVSTVNGIGNLSVASDGTTVVVLVDESSSNVSVGTLISSKDAGEHWQTQRAATGGRVASTVGTFWLIGGVAGNEVHASTDGSRWTTVDLPLEGDWTAGSPSSRTDGHVALPTTRHGDDSSTVAPFDTTDSGQSWQEGAAVEAAPTEFGVAVPAFGAPDGSWIVVQTDGAKVFVGGSTGLEPRTISPNGLPAGIVAVAMLGGSDVVAYGATSDCPNGKSSCRSVAGLWYSGDTGQTWVKISS